ncbi:MAG: hydrogenase [Parcubacteria group bacterium CG11_big_fil_rev_8_21_14_0_20_39_14]|nr:MAG: hydrogenase [Parcubacteria group bacterium CG11_big_fil_rev_8_21_14_0_20_39_14]PIS35087.1 MAG: HypC/HybG/HupF family hydrogenase formation chaperone [Parcubacteria group bacterium CG08_land_8_20_14_0_20_38_56]
MCLAVPSKVTKIKGDWAWVQSQNPLNPKDVHKRRVNLNLVKNIKIGDYLIVHENLALNKVAKTDAKRILKIVEKSKGIC